MLEKKPIKSWGVKADYIVFSKLIERKTNSIYLIGIKFDKTIGPLFLIMPKMSGYVKTSKVKEGGKYKSNKLMSFRIDGEKLSKKYKVIQTNVKDLENIELNALRVYDDRYIKTKIRTYGDRVYTNFFSLNVPEDNIEWESFTAISIDSLLAYKSQYYLQVYLENCL